MGKASSDDSDSQDAARVSALLGAGGDSSAPFRPRASMTSLLVPPARGEPAGEPGAGCAGLLAGTPGTGTCDGSGVGTEIVFLQAGHSTLRPPSCTGTRSSFPHFLHLQSIIRLSFLPAPGRDYLQI